MLGLAVIISKTILLFNAIKIIWAVYLLYLATKLLLSKKTTPQEVVSSNQQKTTQTTQKTTKTNLKYFTEGFLWCILNPKVTLFYLDILVVITIRFSLMPIIINIKFIKQRISKIQFRLEKIMGSVLALLGIKILLETK